MNELNRARARDRKDRALAEYIKLGNQLKQTTQKMLSEKFEINMYSLTAIARITSDDFNLIKALIKDRKETMERRAHLRRLLQG